MPTTTTTTKIYSANVPTWKRWTKAHGGSAEFIKKFIEHVQLRQQAKFYDSLPAPVKIAKVLAGVKIRKKYTQT